jgi:hypothetical protein
MEQEQKKMLDAQLFFQEVTEMVKSRRKDIGRVPATMFVLTNDVNEDGGRTVCVAELPETPFTENTIQFAMSVVQYQKAKTQFLESVKEDGHDIAAIFYCETQDIDGVETLMTGMQFDDNVATRYYKVKESTLKVNEDGELKSRITFTESEVG